MSTEAAMTAMHATSRASHTAGEDSGRHSSAHRRHARRKVAWKFAVERLGVAEASDGERESETGEGDHFDRFVDCEMDAAVVVLVYCLLK